MIDNDLNDPLAELFGGTPVPLAARPTPPASYTPPTYDESCTKCGGSGQFRGYSGRVVGPCFACKGAGKNTFKTSPDKRAKGRVQAATRSAKKAEEFGIALAQYVAAHKAEFDWLAVAAKRNTERAGSFGFPQAMLDAVAKFGTLTENQLASVRKLMIRDEARKVEAKAKIDNAPVIDVSKISGGVRSRPRRGEEGWCPWRPLAQAAARHLRVSRHARQRQVRGGHPRHRGRRQAGPHRGWQVRPVLCLHRRAGRSHPRRRR